MANGKSPEFHTVTRLLDRMSAEERELVRQHLAALRSTNGESITPQAVAADSPVIGPENQDGAAIVIEAILTYLFSTGVSSTPASPTMVVHIKSRPQNKKFVNDCQDVWNYLVKFVPGRLARRSVLALGVALLHENLSKWMTSINYNAMLSQAHRIPSCLDDAFPGYAKAGLLPMAVQHTRKTKA